MNLAKVTLLGSTGTGNLNLDTPLGFDTDGQYLYIADSGNHRILKWTLNGKFVAKIGSSGSGDDNFSTPADILCWKGILYVADKGNHRIKLHRADDLSFKNEFGASGSGNGQFSSPVSLTRRAKSLYVSDSGNHRIQKFNIETFAYESKAGTNGTGNKQLDTPNQIVYDEHEDTLLIVDVGNVRVLKWGYDFKYYDKIITTDSMDGSLAGLSGIAVDPYSGFCYTLESNRTQVFDTSTLTTRDTGFDDSTIQDGQYIKAYPKLGVLLMSLGTNDKILFANNYHPERDLTANTTRVIGGGWFSTPSIPIGGTQMGSSVTIGGTAGSDLFRWKGENSPANRFAWTEETETSSSWTEE